jgi:hypothetical protein
VLDLALLLLTLTLELGLPLLKMLKLRKPLVSDSRALVPCFVHLVVG